MSLLSSPVIFNLSSIVVQFTFGSGGAVNLNPPNFKRFGWIRRLPLSAAFRPFQVNHRLDKHWHLLAIFISVTSKRWWVSLADRVIEKLTVHTNFAVFNHPVASLCP
jgi:hypothetical protein